MYDIVTRYYDEKIVIKRAADICHNGNAGKKTALLYIHGGGWRNGSRELYHKHFQYFAEKEYLCASIGYRLVPEVRVRAQIGDVFKGYDTVVSYAKRQDIDIRNYIIIGSSAGAHLASLAALVEPDHFNKNIKLENEWIKPAGCISINGLGSLEEWEDMDPDIKGCIERLVDAKYEDDADIFKNFSPITYVNQDTTVPFLFLLAEIEPFLPHKIVYPFYNKIKDNGIYARLETYDGSRHGFLYDTDSENSKRALTAMEEFIDRITS
jgi:acetyl esterase/lipase